VTGNINGSATSSSTNQGGGMGFWTSGTITLSGDTITNNKVIAGTSGTQVEADGAGVYQTGASQMNVTKAVVTGNLTTVASAGRSFGGGIAVNGTAAISDSTVQGNNSNSGGGLYQTGGTLLVTGISINSNTALLAGGGRYA
jgi:hypothetical protein